MPSFGCCFLLFFQGATLLLAMSPRWRNPLDNVRPVRRRQNVDRTPLNEIPRHEPSELRDTELMIVALVLLLAPAAIFLLAFWHVCWCDGLLFSFAKSNGKHFIRPSIPIQRIRLGGARSSCSAPRLCAKSAPAVDTRSPAACLQLVYTEWHPKIERQENKIATRR